MISKTEIATGQTTTYTYDVENQLIRIDFPGGTYAEYAYDGLGRRIQKDVNGSITRYVYDSEDILLEYDGANVAQARYTHGAGVDEPLVMERDLDQNGSFDPTERFFYHTDGLGTIVDLTDNAGAIAQSYVYDSFGNIVTVASGLVNPYMYTGREFDEESELYFYRARYMDSQTGRFLQEDPLGNADGPNLYTYVHNNPINWTDPSGLKTKAECWDDFGFCGRVCAALHGNTDPEGLAECNQQCWDAYVICEATAEGEGDDDNEDPCMNFNVPPPDIGPPMTFINPPVFIPPPTNPNINFNR